jgi:acyl carrier protein
MENTPVSLGDIVKIINECALDGATLPDKNLVNVDFIVELGMDSLDLINVFFKLEQSYGIQITSDNFDQHNLMIIGNLVSYINVSR